SGGADLERRSPVLVRLSVLGQGDAGEDGGSEGDGARVDQGQFAVSGRLLWPMRPSGCRADRAPGSDDAAADRSRGERRKANRAAGSGAVERCLAVASAP